MYGSSQVVWLEVTRHRPTGLLEVQDLLSGAVLRVLHARGIEKVYLRSRNLQQRLSLEGFRALNVAQGPEHFAEFPLTGLPYNVIYATKAGQVGVLAASPSFQEAGEELPAAFLPMVQPLGTASCKQQDRQDVARKARLIVAASPELVQAARVYSADSSICTAFRLCHLLQQPMIGAGTAFSLQAAEELLQDRFSPSGYELSQLLHESISADSSSSEHLQAARRALAGFQGIYTPEDIAPSIIEAVRAHLLNSLDAHSGVLNGANLTAFRRYSTSSVR